MSASFACIHCGREFAEPTAWYLHMAGSEGACGPEGRVERAMKAARRASTEEREQ